MLRANRLTAHIPIECLSVKSARPYETLEMSTADHLGVAVELSRLWRQNERNDDRYDSAALHERQPNACLKWK